MKLDPATLAALADLTLAARIIVDGTMFGAHRSRMPGSGGVRARGWWKIAAIDARIDTPLTLRLAAVPLSQGEKEGTSAVGRQGARRAARKLICLHDVKDMGAPRNAVGARSSASRISGT